MKKITLLDCTLRDGAYVVDANFGKNAIKGIIKKAQDANVELIDFAGEKTVDKELADMALTRLDVDKAGLDLIDRRYLRCIAEKYAGGPVGAETLSAALSEERDTIEEIIEPYLMQLGLVMRTPRGRMLSEAGWKHLGLFHTAQKQGDLLAQL